MTKEQYGEWKQHPATKFFLQFIIDRRNDLIRDATSAWLNGAESFNREGQVDRGRIYELMLLTELSFDMIEQFYKDRNATEDIEDGIR